MNIWLIIYLLFSGQHAIPEIGVVDRIEGGKAVVLLEQKGDELVISTERFDHIITEDSWLLLTVRNNEPIILIELAGLADRQRKKSNTLIGELREKSQLFQHGPNGTGISPHLQKYRFIR